MAAQRAEAGALAPAPVLAPCGRPVDELPPGWVFPPGWKPSRTAPAEVVAAVDVLPGQAPVTPAQENPAEVVPTQTVVPTTGRKRGAPKTPSIPRPRVSAPASKGKPKGTTPPPAKAPTTRRPTAKPAAKPAAKRPSKRPTTTTAPASGDLTSLVGPAWTPDRVKEPRNAGAAPIGGFAPENPLLKSAPRQPARHDALAVGSLVLGVLWLAGVGSLLALALGHVSRRRAAAERRYPSGVAKAGSVLGWIGLALVPVVFLLVVPALQAGDAVAPAKAALERVADAQEQHRDATGAYADDVDELDGVTAGEVVVVRADAEEFCLRADDGSGRSWYRGSLRPGVSTTPC